MAARLAGLVLLSLVVMLGFVPQVRAARPTMALDGSWSMCSNPLTRYCPSPSTIASLTTTHDDDVIVLVAQSKSGSNRVTSVADNDGHAWTLRGVINGPNPIWEYYTIANSPLSSDIVNVTWSHDVPPGSGYDAFIVFGVSGANTHNPWVPKFPVEITGWNGSSVALSVAGAGDFVIVSTAVNDAPPCFTTTNILPFQTIGEIGDGVYGEADYFIKGTGGRTTVSFSCNPYSDPMTFLGDALRGPGSQQ